MNQNLKTFPLCLSHPYCVLRQSQWGDEQLERERLKRLPLVEENVSHPIACPHQRKLSATPQGNMGLAAQCRLWWLLLFPGKTAVCSTLKKTISALTSRQDKELTCPEPWWSRLLAPLRRPTWTEPAAFQHFITDGKYWTYWFEMPCAQAIKEENLWSFTLFGSEWLRRPNLSWCWRRVTLWGIVTWEDLSYSKGGSAPGAMMPCLELDIWWPLLPIRKHISQRAPWILFWVGWDTLLLWVSGHKL